MVLAHRSALVQAVSPGHPLVPPAGADRHSGRRNLWLRALDAAGLGFDS